MFIIRNGQQVELTQQEEDAIIAEWNAGQTQMDLEKTPAYIRSQEIIKAKIQIENDLKDFAILVMKENNLIRDWATKFMAATAASTSLADLKTRVANLPSLPQRTIQQLKDALGV